MAKAVAAALADDTVELDEVAVTSLPIGDVCATCAHFAAPVGDAAKIRQVGGEPRGDCLLAPTAVKKLPTDRCAQHSVAVAQARGDQAQAIVAALAPVIERGLQTIAQSIEAAATVKHARS